MPGMPAARQGDATLIGGPIVQGSLGVMIGAPTGVACSACPGGVAVGNPVNPVLGAKVLPGETDIALPAHLPFVLTRSYSSYRTDTPAPVGTFGPGWRSAMDIRLQIHSSELILNDNGGRSIHFDVLAPGAIAWSPSEKLWLARGGVDTQPDNHRLSRLWQALPPDVRLNSHTYFVANDATGPWWILEPFQLPVAPDDVLPRPLPPFRVLSGLVDRSGNQLHYHRDAEGEFAGQVTAVTDSSGRRFRLELATLPAGTRLAAVWLVRDAAFPDLPSTPLVRYDYSPRGELAAVYDRAGVKTRHFEWHPQTAGLMTAHQHTGRPASRYVYDDTLRVISQSNPGGLNYQFVYSDNQTVVTDSLGRVTVYHFEGKRGLKRVVRLEQPDGSDIHSEFDGSGRLVSQTDAAGRKTEYQLDVVSGNLLAIWYPDGTVSRFDYNAHNQLLSTTAPDGGRTAREYDSCGRLTAQTDAMGHTRRWHYADEKSAHPSATEDAAGGRQQLEWNAYGLLASYTDCSGYKTQYRYNRDGQVTEMRAEEGLPTRYEYDVRGRLTASEDSTGTRTTRQYNEAGDLLTITHPDSTITTQRYDGRGNQLSQTAGGLTRQAEYDSAGRITGLINENAARTQFSYDVMDRLTAETGFDGREHLYHYSLAGQLIRSEDAALVTRWHYDDNGKLIRRERPPLPDGTPDEMLFDHDDAGRLSEIAHRSENHLVCVRYEYNGNGRVTAEHQLIHNAQGDRLWEYSVARKYDPRGFESTVTYDGLPDIQWQTYGPGHLLGVKLGDEPLLELTRDRLHRETRRQFGDWQSTSAYTPRGQLAQQQTRDSHPALNRDYHYSAAGLLTGIHTGHGEQHYTYSPSGRLESARLGDTILTTLTDPAGNRNVTLAHDFIPGPEDRHTWKDNRTGQDERYTYRYDKHGNLSEKCRYLSGWTGEEYAPDETHHYHYDQSHRLTRYTREDDGKPTAQGRYVYDPLGRRVGKLTAIVNPTTKQTDTQHSWYGWDGDRLVLTESQGTQRHTIYQPGSFVPLLRVGQTKKEDNHSSLAEKLERDAEVTFPPVLHQRLNVIEQELRKNQLSDDTVQFLSATGLKAENLALWLEPEADSDRKIHLYHCDHLGTPLALVNREGHIDWHITLDPWGNVLSEHNPQKLHQPLRMQGQQYDEESGLHYNRHRYYEPQQGRYITQDPIGLAGGMNGYKYVLNPLKNIDPLGLSGDMTIYSSGDGGASMMSGHSWISYTPDNGTTTTYGTWGNNPTGHGNGLFENLELSRSADATRTIHIDDIKEKELYDLIKKYKDKGNDAWKLSSPCSSFARDAWNTAANENLNSNYGFISNPTTLKNAIIDANGGIPHGIMVYPNGGNSASSGASGRSSGSSMNSSGSFL